jgi:hypothetical protein
MMHDKARRRYEQLLRDAPGPASRDALLDQLYDNLTRATEWDAEQWGFSPDLWMRAERAELGARGGSEYPGEAV